MASGREPVAIRVATRADRFALAALARQTFADAFGADMGTAAIHAHLENHLSDRAVERWFDDDQIFVALAHEALVGFVQVGRVNSEYRQFLPTFDADAVEIRRLYVLQILQDAGVGSALLARGLLQSSAGGAVYLTTWESNRGAQRLYRRNGFIKVGEMPEYGEEGDLNGYEHILVRPRQASR